MPDNKGQYDWIGSLTPRIRKAYKPPVTAPIFQALSQGFVGRQIAQKALRQAIMTARMKTHQPMITEEGKERPATIKEVMDIMQPQGVLGKIFAPREQPELTWKPIATTKYAEEYPWKAQLETFKSGLQAIIEEQKLKNQKEIEKYKSELGAETPLTKEKVKKLEYENEQLRLMTESATEAFEKARGKNIIETINDFFKGLITSFAGKIGVKMPEVKTPTGVPPTGVPPTGVQGELPGMEVTPPTPPTPTPTPTGIPDWLQREVEYYRGKGATEEEIAEHLRFYGY